MLAVATTDTFFRKCNHYQGHVTKVEGCKKGPPGQGPSRDPPETLCECWVGIRSTQMRGTDPHPTPQRDHINDSARRNARSDPPPLVVDKVASVPNWIWRPPKLQLKCRYLSPPISPQRLRALRRAIPKSRLFWDPRPVLGPKSLHRLSGGVPGPCLAPNLIFLHPLGHFQNR